MTRIRLRHVWIALLGMCLLLDRRRAVRVVWANTMTRRSPWVCAHRAAWVDIRIGRLRRRASAVRLVSTRMMLVLACAVRARQGCTRWMWLSRRARRASRVATLGLGRVSAVYVLAVGMTMMVTRRRHVCFVGVVGTRLLGGRIAPVSYTHLTLPTNSLV